MYSIAALPAFPLLKDNEIREALDRLIDVALNHDSGAARRVADFLLAWWNGPDNGDFRVIDIAIVDRAIGKDMLTLLAALVQYQVHYADVWGRRAEMVAIVEAWR